MCLHGMALWQEARCGEALGGAHEGADSDLASPVGPSVLISHKHSERIRGRNYPLLIILQK